MTILEELQHQVQQLPPELQREVLDFATFLQQRQLPRPLAAEEQRGQRIRAALLALAKLHVFADMPDPGAWQREVRQDRTLPERAT